MSRAGWKHCASYAALISQFFVTSIGFAGDLFNGWGRKHPRSPLMEMAAEVDKLEKEIDEFGSIVAKQPDVWGEARWTRHRDEYEKQLHGQLTKFGPTLQARQSQSDSAFFLDAMALSGAMGPAAPGSTAPSADVTQIFTEGKFPQFEALSRDNNFDVASPLDASKKVEVLSIEPTEYLNQLSTYLGHLHQLRRINEGDDTADAAGYALNLMRIPVSVLPGKKTRQGYGAEVTFTLTPELTDNLLKDTFKSLVMNDLVDQLGLPVVKLAENHVWEGVFGKDGKSRLDDEIKLLECINQKIANPNPDAPDAGVSELLKLIRSCSEITEVFPNAATRRKVIEIRQEIRQKLLKLVPKGQNPSDFFNSFSSVSSGMSFNKNDMSDDKILSSSFVQPVAFLVPTLDQKQTFQKSANILLQDIIAEIQATLSAAISNVQASLSSAGAASMPVSAPRDRRARYAVPPTEISCVFHNQYLADIAKDLDAVRESNGRLPLQLTDAQGFLTEQLDAAYRLLEAYEKSGESGMRPWDLCPQISQAVVRLKYRGSSGELDQLRQAFESIVPAPMCTKPGEACRGETIRALAWAILVESALLNERLLEDMKRVETAKGSFFVSSEGLQFYRPHPDSETQTVFNEYVRLRWPIHVFAIDPVMGEQNIADASSRRRETQLALALAFTRGEMSAQKFSRFSRRVDHELDTVALNRTIVGFSHGTDTFGWRMTPRVQAPPIEGNAKVFFRDLLTGPPSRDQDLRKRQLEPGMRELLAIVIMPGFVPHARLDIRTNWFHLTHPDKKQFTTEDSVRMGQMVQYLKLCKAQCSTEQTMNRPGDSRRLLTAVEQLEKRLPLQDTVVQIPYENSEGGFQLFSEGTRNLGPELIGYYGAPGLDPAKGGELFLVGRNFNVNVTQVIIGGRVAEVTLLSREVMKVKVGSGLTTCEIRTMVRGEPKPLKVIDAHIATPYGVSSTLHIATEPAQSPAVAKYKVPSEVKACLAYANCNVAGIALPAPITIEGVEEGDQVLVSLKAVLADANEVDLQADVGTDAPKLVNPLGIPVDQKFAGILDAHLALFLKPKGLLWADNKPIVFKMGVSVQPKDPAAKPVIAGAVTIRLTSAGACSPVTVESFGSPCFTVPQLPLGTAVTPKSEGMIALAAPGVPARAPAVGPELFCDAPSAAWAPLNDNLIPPPPDLQQFPALFPQ